MQKLWPFPKAASTLLLAEPTNGIWRLLDTGALSNGWRFYRAEQAP
jgi:hypothetical protein